MKTVFDEQPKKPKQRSVGKKILSSFLFLIWVILMLGGLALAIPAMMWQISLEISEAWSNALQRFLDGE